MPCHTYFHGIVECVLSLNNIEEILTNWDEWYFSSKQNAESAGKKRINKNKETMKKLQMYK